MYVSRYSTTIKQDIELGFSCWMGDLGTDILSALEFDGFNAEGLEASYERLGAQYDSFEDYLREVVLDKSNVVWDARFGAYRSFHHAGLSCWVLDAETETGAIAEAAEKGIGVFELGDYTIGHIRIVGEVAPNLWVLECESVGRES